MSDEGRPLTTKEQWIVWSVIGSALFFWLLGVITFIRWVWP
jgi:hypothetical protein